MVCGRHVTTEGRVPAQAGRQGGLFRGPQVIDQGSLHTIAAYQSVSVL